MTPELFKANELVGMQRFADAERVLRQLLAESPNIAIAHALLGVCLATQGRARAALKSAETAISLDPTEDYAFYAQSLALEGCQRPRQSIRAIREAIRLSSTNPAYLHRLACIYFAKKHWRRCLTTLEKARQLHPRHVDCMTLRGKALIHLGRREEARQAFDAALDINPENAETHRARGALLLFGSQSEAGLDHLLEARRLNPITSNDSDAIALAVGLQMRPFCWLNRLLPRWYLWPPKMLCFCMISLMAVYAFCWMDTPRKPTAAKILAVATFNLLWAPVTFDVWAAATARLLQRRRIGVPWHVAILRIPMALYPVVPHTILTILAMAGVPAIVIMALAMASCWKFLANFFRAFLEDRLTALLYVAYSIALAFASCMAAIVEAGMVHVFFALSIFAVLALLSNNVSDWIRRLEQ